MPTAKKTTVAPKDNFEPTEQIRPQGCGFVLGSNGVAYMRSSVKGQAIVAEIAKGAKAKQEKVIADQKARKELEKKELELKLEEMKRQLDSLES